MQSVDDGLAAFVFCFFLSLWAQNGDSRSLSPIDVHEHMIRSPPPVIPATFRFPGGVKLDAKGGADR